MGRPGLTILVAGLACALLAGLAVADEFRAEARVDRNTVGVGGRLVLTIEVYGGGQISEPDLEDIEGFTVVNTSRSQTLSIVNFNAVRSLTLRYVLVAQSEGEYTLGPFKVQSGKEIFETEPIRVTVVKGESPPPAPSQSGSGDDEVMVRASVDKSRVYVGEQITYNLQFAYRVSPRDIDYTPPDHTGFWTEEIGETGPAIETINGKRYYVVNKRTAFFPISSGRFTIGEASIRYVVSETRSFSFDPFAMARGREGRAATEPVDVVVRQLPSEGRPAGFTGAVGNFELAVSPSAGEVRAGESLTLSVRISGRGNIKSIGDITVPDMQGFRVFAPKARESTNVEDLKVGGEKVFDLVLVPERPGDLVIPAFEFPFFDPAKQAYVTLRSGPISIKVTQGDVASTGGTSGLPAGFQAARADIRYIERGVISRDALTLSHGGITGLMATYLPAIIGIVGFLISVQRRRTLISGKGAMRQAHRSAMQDLKRARGLATGDSSVAEAAGLAAKAIRSYIAVLAGTSEALVDRPVLSSLNGIGEATRSGLADLLDILDRIRFSPVGADPDEVADLVGRAESLLRTAHAESSK